MVISIEEAEAKSNFQIMLLQMTIDSLKKKYNISNLELVNIMKENTLKIQNELTDIKEGD